MDQVRGRTPQPAFVVVLSNDSMFPRYQAGAHLRVDPSEAVAIGDEVCVGAGPGQTMLIGVLIKAAGSVLTLRQYGRAMDFDIDSPVLVAKVIQPDEFLF